MTLIDPTGKEKERELQILSSSDEAGLSKVLIKFLAPPDIRNTGLLTWEQPGDKEDDQWLYLPATRTPKRIASSGKKGSFMNTDLAYEDLRPEDLDAHTYNVLREEDLGGQKCWVIEALPSTDKEKLESGYGKRVFWVRKDLYLTVQTEFYNKSDKLLQTADVLGPGQRRRRDVAGQGDAGRDPGSQDRHRVDDARRQGEPEDRREPADAAGADAAGDLASARPP